MPPRAHRSGRGKGPPVEPEKCGRRRGAARCRGRDPSLPPPRSARGNDETRPVFPARSNTGDPFALRGLSANEIDRALISMVARGNTPLQSEAGYIDARPQTRSMKLLAMHGRTIHLVRWKTEALVKGILAIAAAQHAKRPPAAGGQCFIGTLAAHVRALR